MSRAEREREAVRVALERLAAGDAARLATFRAEAEVSFEAIPPRDPSPEDQRELSLDEIDALHDDLVAADASPSRAEHARSRDALLGALVVELVRWEDQWVQDWRDLLVALAPYHQGAHGLGEDPVTVFDEAAAAGPASIAEHVRSFGRRTDITPRQWPGLRRRRWWRRG